MSQSKYKYFMQCVIAGLRRMTIVIKRMLGKAPNIYFRSCWMFFSPVLVLVSAMANSCLFNDGDEDLLWFVVVAFTFCSSDSRT